MLGKRRRLDSRRLSFPPCGRTAQFHPRPLPRLPPLIAFLIFFQILQLVLEGDVVAAQVVHFGFVADPRKLLSVRWRARLVDFILFRGSWVVDAILVLHVFDGLVLHAVDRCILPFSSSSIDRRGGDDCNALEDVYVVAHRGLIGSLEVNVEAALPSRVRATAEAVVFPVLDGYPWSSWARRIHSAGPDL